MFNQEAINEANIELIKANTELRAVIKALAHADRALEQYKIAYKSCQTASHLQQKSMEEQANQLAELQHQLNDLFASRSELEMVAAVFVECMRRKRMELDRLQDTLQKQEEEQLELAKDIRNRLAAERAQVIQHQRLEEEAYKRRTYRLQPNPYFWSISG